MTIPNRLTLPIALLTLAAFPPSAAQAQEGRLVDPPLGATLEGSVQRFSWSGGTNALEYRLHVGTNPGSRELYSQSHGRNTFAVVPRLPTDGRPLFVTLESRIFNEWRQHTVEYKAAPSESGEIVYESDLGGDRVWVFSMPHSPVTTKTDWTGFVRSQLFGLATDAVIHAVFGVSGPPLLSLFAELIVREGEKLDPTNVVPLLAPASKPDGIASIPTCVPGSDFNVMGILDHVQVWNDGGRLHPAEIYINRYELFIAADSQQVGRPSISRTLLTPAEMQSLRPDRSYIMIPKQAFSLWSVRDQLGLDTTTVPLELPLSASVAASVGFHKTEYFTPMHDPAPEPAPKFDADGVANVTGGTAGIVSPGGLVAIYGTDLGPSTPIGGRINDSNVLAGTAGCVTVLVDGEAAPLFYVSDRQVNLQVPFGVSYHQDDVEMIVIHRNTASPPARVQIRKAAPALFEHSSAPGDAIALNQDGTLNAAALPARSGDILTLYANGAGPTEPPMQSGERSEPPYPSPTEPVSVTIGGQNGEILFAGMAPGYVGLLQINVRVPANAAGLYVEQAKQQSTTSMRVPIILTIGAAPANPLFVYIDNIETGGNGDRPTSAPSLGLSAHYALDGNLLDSSKNAAHGRADSNLSYGADGAHGSALLLDSADDYARLPYSILSPAGSFSFSLWFRSSLDIDQWQTLLHKSGCGADGVCQPGNVRSPAVHLSIARRGYAQNRLVLYLTDGDLQFEYEVRSTLPVVDGKWHHAVATLNFETKTAQLFIDGRLEGMASVPGYDFAAIGYSYDHYNANDVFLGVASDGRNRRAAFPAAYFDGSIDEIYFYDRVLSMQEVQQLCQSDAPSGHQCRVDELQ